MRIIQKKRKNKVYFYLRQNIRVGKKTITKELYLGEKIPKNLWEIEEKFKRDLNSELNKKLIAIRDNFQKEWKKIPPRVRLEQLKEIAIAFTYNSNAIEGSTITLDETREIVEQNLSAHKPIRDIKETQAHVKTFLSMLEQKDKINENLIKDWHKKIFSETNQEIAGIYRNYLVRVGEYLTPDWQDISKLMKELIEYVKNKSSNKDRNPVDFAFRVHYKFEKIHPFGDGNGRVGRILMNYLLWKSKYPMLIIEYKNRKSYYKALKKSEDDFVKYGIRRYLKVHEKRITIA
jgi:Fic family protein